MTNKNTLCLWYDGTAADAAQFYAETFPDSEVGAPVLVLEIVGVLPDIDAEERRLAGGEWRVLVRQRRDGELPAAVERQPGPAAAEDSAGPPGAAAQAA